MIEEIVEEHCAIAKGGVKALADGADGSHWRMRLRGDGGTMRQRFDRMGAFALFLVVVLPLFALFFATASRDRPYHIDPLSNVIPAWKIGSEGTIYLDEYVEFTAPEYWRSVGWYVAVDDTAVSKYPPGTALWAAPFYAIGPNDAELVVGRPTNERDSFDTVEILIPPLWPAAVASSLAVALAMGWLALTVASFASPANAATAAYLGALGTTAWGVASDSLWQHGPAMMWIALAGYLMVRSNRWSGGIAYAAAIVTRPLTAMVAAGSGTYEAWKRRSVKTLLQVAIPAAVGVGVIVIYNTIVFGSVSIAGGYGDGFSSNVLSSDVGGFLVNLFRAGFDLSRGLFVWSPFILVLLAGIRTGWTSAPAWARGAALGGLVYFLVQMKANRYSGGDGFIGYRYPLEPLMAAAPLLFFSYRDWVLAHRMRQRLFVFTAALAVAIQAAAVVAI